MFLQIDQSGVDQSFGKPQLQLESVRSWKENSQVTSLRRLVPPGREQRTFLVAGFGCPALHMVLQLIRDSHDSSG